MQRLGPQPNLEIASPLVSSCAEASASPLPPQPAITAPPSRTAQIAAARVIAIEDFRRFRIIYLPFESCASLCIEAPRMPKSQWKGCPANSVPSTWARARSLVCPVGSASHTVGLLLVSDTASRNGSRTRPRSGLWGNQSRMPKQGRGGPQQAHAPSRRVNSQNPLRSLENRPLAEQISSYYPFYE